MGVTLTDSQREALADICASVGWACRELTPDRQALVDAGLVRAVQHVEDEWDFRYTKAGLRLHRALELEATNA